MCCQQAFWLRPGVQLAADTAGAFVDSCCSRQFLSLGLPLHGHARRALTTAATKQVVGSKCLASWLPVHHIHLGHVSTYASSSQSYTWQFWNTDGNRTSFIDWVYIFSLALRCYACWC